MENENINSKPGQIEDGDNRNIALDMMSAVPTENITDKGELLLSTVYPKPLTEHTLKNIESSMESEIINGMSVVAARAFDMQTIQNSEVPVQSVDYPIFSGLREITSIYAKRLKEDGVSPKQFVKAVTNIAGEYLMHTTEEKGQKDTKDLLKDMMSKEKFGILRLDSTQAFSDIPATVRILKDMKSNLNNRSFYSAVEIKPSEKLPDLQSNLNAYNDLKTRLVNEDLPLLISLDIRAIAPFFEASRNFEQMTDEQKRIFWEQSEEKRIQFIDNILTNSPKDIGLIELSGTNYYDRINHSSPFEDKPSQVTVDLVQQKEKSNPTWGLPNSKLGFIIETHPVILKQFTKELSEKGKTLL